MSKPITNTQYENVITAVTPTIDRMTANWIELTNDKNADEGREPVSGRDIEYYRLAIVIDLLNAIGRYIKPTDAIGDIESSADYVKGVVKIACEITRDGQGYYFYTRAIRAGGPGTKQCAHYRYIVETPLSVLHDMSPAAVEFIKQRKAMQVEDRVNADIAHMQKCMDRDVNEITTKAAMSDSEIIGTRFDFYTWAGLIPAAKQSYGTEEAFNEEIDRRKAEDIRSHRQRYSTRRLNEVTKDYTRRIERLKAKLS